MSRSSLPWLVLGAIVVAAALAWFTLTRGDKAPSANAQRYPLAPFHEIAIGGQADVTLVQGDIEAIDADVSGRGRVEASVANGRLSVHAVDRRRFFDGLFGHRKAERSEIRIHLRNLDKLGLGGNVNVSIPKLRTTALHIEASGGASLAIDDLQATTLTVDGSGALKAEVKGRVEEEHVSISGAGSFSAEGLRANHATVSVSGVGKVAVHAEQTLRADISGAGLIEYAGNPQVTEHVSGIGRVKRIESTAVPGMRIAQAPLNAAAATPLRLP
ncbi:MAG TPA: DUF2807 domain-containing protein [Casimicrobiaceae bacterium]|nr:DUF2807 domain-containing protein [Casimicrobiaceae bacterium]